MKTETSKRSTLLRTLVLLPLLALLIFGFSSREIIQKEAPVPTFISTIDQASPKQYEAYNKLASYWNNRFTETNKRIIPIAELNKLESMYRVLSSEQKNVAQPFPKCDPPKQKEREKATKEQVNEYNKLARKYNTMDKENMFAKKKDVERLKYLYDLMSLKQRKDAEPFPSFPPPPPPPPKAPKAPKEPKSVKVTKGVNDMDPNVPPPPPKAPKPPKSNKVVKGVNDMDSDIPPPPPPIVSEEPLDHIVRMAYENAAFFYENKRITSDEAIAIFKKNRNLNIETETFKNSNPIVKITKEGITIKK